MKARIEEGKIVKYNTIPNSFKASGKLILGGGKNLSNEKLEEYGFFDVIVPDYDPVIEEIYNLHFDSDENAFVYDKRTKVISETVAELKIRQINILKDKAYHKLSSTDWYAIRKAENGTDIPASVETERDAIRNSVATKESEIKALTTKASILKYDINF